MAQPRLTFLELVNVAGESHCQDALREITGGGEGTVRRDATAHLIPEPENPYDPDAVRIEVDGMKVGYLPRSLAGDYLALVGPIAARGRVAACEALIAGHREGDSSAIGVFMRLPPPGPGGTEDVSRRF